MFYFSAVVVRPCSLLLFPSYFVLEGLVLASVGSVPAKRLVILHICSVYFTCLSDILWSILYILSRLLKVACHMAHEIVEIVMFGLLLQRLPKVLMVDGRLAFDRTFVGMLHFGFDHLLDAFRFDILDLFAGRTVGRT